MNKEQEEKKNTSVVHWIFSKKEHKAKIKLKQQQQQQQQQTNKKQNKTNNLLWPKRCSQLSNNPRAKWSSLR